MKNLHVFLLLTCSLWAQGVGNRTYNAAVTVPATGSLDRASATMQKMRQAPTLPTTCSTTVGESFQLVTGTYVVPYTNTSTTGTCAWAPVGFGGFNMSGFYPNAQFLPLNLVSVASGTTDLYTVPAGKRLFLYGYATTDLGSGNSCGPQVKIGSTYYYVGTSNAAGGTIGYIYEAGEVVALHCDFGPVAFYANTLLYDNTAGPKSYKVAGLTTGLNLLTTVPAGMIVPVVSTTPSQTSGTIQLVTDAAASRTFTAYLTPSGGSPMVVSAVITLTAHTRTTTGLAATLYPGDSLSVNVDVGDPTQFVWINVLELSTTP